eukprot:6392544-Amphidinium_carterae.1
MQGRLPKIGCAAADVNLLPGRVATPLFGRKPAKSNQGGTRQSSPTDSQTGKQSSQTGFCILRFGAKPICNIK